MLNLKIINKYYLDDLIGFNLLFIFAYNKLQSFPTVSVELSPSTSSNTWICPFLIALCQLSYVNCPISFLIELDK